MGGIRSPRARSAEGIQKTEPQDPQPNLRAAGEPSASEIGKAKREALRAVHPDLLMGSPDLISADPAGLKTCLVEYPNVKG